MDLTRERNVDLRGGDDFQFLLGFNSLTFKAKSVPVGTSFNSFLDLTYLLLGLKFNIVFNFQFLLGFNVGGKARCMDVTRMAFQFLLGFNVKLRPKDLIQFEVILSIPSWI